MIVLDGTQTIRVEWHNVALVWREEDIRHVDDDARLVADQWAALKVRTMSPGYTSVCLQFSKIAQRSRVALYTSVCRIGDAHPKVTDGSGGPD